MNEPPLVFIENNKPVTDSLTVATAFLKDHARVLRDIRELGCSESFRLGNFAESSYINQQRREMPKVVMTEQGFTLLVMGYTGQRAMDFKERYIAEFDRMRSELSQRNLADQYNLPRSYPEALRALAEESERNEAMQRVLEEQAPKVALYDVAMQAENAQAIGTVAKTLGVGPNKLFRFLREKKVLMSHGSRYNQPYQTYLDRGYFAVREYTVTHTQHIENKTQTMVTPAGFAYIHRLLVEAGMVTSNELTTLGV
ncbi:Rha family transcriptional regulator [Alicyclobacillus sp. SO9]|uniref:Rha family transcriptional regulator n=1 Tax=Alicyclobacillus sp. SO9 TaxID=2665646 RepID=UPI0018E78750|nr:phage antirepressor KilAC domain-containing protein [Alicyclobacillus sp. SO9]QQE80899.1 phage antirepressor KilAC domain-containing protein [Alicyclobacillus sp. SO9]